MQNFWKSAYVSDLDAVVILAEHVTDLLDHPSFKRSIPNGQARGQKRTTNLFSRKNKKQQCDKGQNTGQVGIVQPYRGL